MPVFYSWMLLLLLPQLKMEVYDDYHVEVVGASLLLPFIHHVWRALMDAADKSSRPTGCPSLIMISPVAFVADIRTGLYDYIIHSR